MDEIKRSKNVILFVDELHTIVGAGSAEGAMDASNIIKPALSRGELQVVGATTMNEYRKYIEKDAALERRFQTIIVEPPTVDQTVEIFEGPPPEIRGASSRQFSMKRCSPPRGSRTGTSRAGSYQTRRSTSWMKPGRAREFNR